MAEDEVIQQLAKTCDPDGKELKPKQSAKLFHKLGLIYKTEGLQEADKIKLIQSAALLNAAIFRDPENIEEIKQDLCQFCFELLISANAANLEADLVKHANLIAKDVEEMRKEVNKKLVDILKIPDQIPESQFKKLKSKKVGSIYNLQVYISEEYTKIMKCLAGFCEEIMGIPPCEYALVGLGSLSRREITPYSDFENVIVLDDSIAELSKKRQEKVKEYFRWFAVTFQIILINLGETILPAVHIPSLNSGDSTKFNLYDAITRLGISFDGMMPHACKSPLGRQMKTTNKQFVLELIQTVSKMASFIGSDEDIKNGYHLADMLMTSCFVSGSQQVYQQFKELVEKEISLLDRKTFVSSVHKQIRENSKDFQILKQLEQSTETYKLNIKRMVYRSSTLFVSAIGKIHGIESPCCFDILENLIQQKLIPKTVGCDLKFAIAIACEIRLRIYMDKKSQDDVVQQSKIKSKFIDETVGIKSLLEYFLIITPFQENIFDLQKIAKPDTYLVPQTCYYLHNYTYAIEWGNQNLYENSINNTLYKFRTLNLGLSHYWVAVCKYELKQFKEASTDLQISLEIHQQLPEDATKSKWISIYHYWIGRCKYELQQYEDSFIDLLSSLEMQQQITEDPSKDTWLASCHFWLGLCKYGLGQYEKSQTNLLSAFNIHKQIVEDPNKSNWISLCHYWIGLCKYELNQFEEALEHVETSCRIEEKLPQYPNTVVNIVSYNYRIGLCKYNLNRRADALPNFKSALECQDLLTQNPNYDGDVANYHYWIGLCNYDLSNFKVALPDLQLSLEIRRNISRDLNNDEKVAKCLYQCGMCKYFLNQYQEAMADLQAALTIYNKATKSSRNSQKIAYCYHWISKCKTDIKL